MFSIFLVFETHTMFARSSDSDRAIAGAYSFLTGFYPPGKGPLIEYANIKVEAKLILYLDKNEKK